MRDLEKTLSVCVMISCSLFRVTFIGKNANSRGAAVVHVCAVHARQVQRRLSYGRSLSQGKG